MIRLITYAFMALVFTGCSNHQMKHEPTNFVFLTDIDPTIIEHSRYFTSENFLGRPVIGYNGPRISCTREAALALKSAQAEFLKDGYRLVVYDGYRPQRAVNEFVKWSLDKNDQVAKHLYYPTINKAHAFKLGYIAKKSGHSRGSTFDLTLIPIGQKLQDIKVTSRELLNGEVIPFLDDNTVDMGSSFDLFHQVSNHDSLLVTPKQHEMRNFLRSVMKKHGFKEYKGEWWHYTLEHEPYPNTYFDYVIEQVPLRDYLNS